jgi:HAD superfamily hydrolase (TIGR01509 family)
MNIAYLFDFDGTLVDSMPTFVSSMLRILDENNIPYGDDIIKIITPLGLNGTAEYYIHTMGLQMRKEQLICTMKEYMLDAYFHTIPAKPNVISVLKTLKDRGASLNVLTASPHITLDACLKRLGMWELFDNVWSCDDFATTKADPEIYIRAAQRMGTSVEKVLFLDDNYNADKVAKSAGMLVCGVYDESSRDYVEQMKSVTDFYIYDFSELPKLQIEKKA